MGCSSIHICSMNIGEGNFHIMFKRLGHCAAIQPEAISRRLAVFANIFRLAACCLADIRPFRSVLALIAALWAGLFKSAVWPIGAGNAENMGLGAQGEQQIKTFRARFLKGFRYFDVSCIIASACASCRFIC